MNENQETVTKWGEETFGPCHPGAIARRMAKEVQELLDVFERVGDTPVAELDSQTLTDLQVECGDIAIMLDQVAELLQVELQDVKNFKMSINRGRRWEWNEEKQQTRHVEDFVEEGCGCRLRLDRWYALSDSGTAFSTEGFATAEEALAWIQAPEQCEEYGHDPDWAGIPPWDPEEFNWDDGGDSGFGINVVYGRDLYDFWQNVYKEEGKHEHNN